MKRPAPCREPDHLPFFDLAMETNNQDYRFGVISARPVCNDLCSIKEWCYTTFREEEGVIAGKTLPERKGEVDTRLVVRTPPCGTLAGYYRHHRLHEPTCGPCRAAMTETKRKKSRAEEVA